jgi:dimethylargininase
MVEGLRTHISRIALDHTAAVDQHCQYCSSLASLGVQVVTLDVNPLAPDAVFIEDTAIVLPELAVLASMGNEARRGEPAAIEPMLRRYREIVPIEPPATIEGGDVLIVGRTLLVGLSSRTNSAGIASLNRAVERYGYQVRSVPVRGCLHLKTSCTALPDGGLLVNPGWIDADSVKDFKLVPVPAAEPWGANTLTIDGTVVLAAEHERTADLIRQRGIAVETVPLSEFAKAEGGVTCLSLVFEIVQTRTLASVKSALAKARG